MNGSYDERLRKVIAIHFHPEKGSRYWLERQKRLGFDAVDQVRGMKDLWKLGPMPLEDLRSFPVEDFVPQYFLDSNRCRIHAETGGATGIPKSTCYFEDEFNSVFVDSFLSVADAVGFGKGLWMWVGPGGPHIIGKAAMAIAKKRSGADAFAVDFDPRWYRRLAPESLARRRYMEHLIEQTLRVLERERVENIFTTPSVLTQISSRMTPSARKRIRGIYLGGMSIEENAMRILEEAFPFAVFAAGYGNTLFGVCHAAYDLKKTQGEIRYFAQSSRISLNLVREDDALTDEERIRMEIELGEEGQIMFHRLDESVFLANVLERDRGVKVAAEDSELRLGFAEFGIANPGPVRTRTFTVDAGIY